MFKNYIKVAWRNIIRNKVYSILNILGLAIGLSVPLMIGLWVAQQFSYDRWLPASQQALQVRFNYNDNGVIRTQNEVCLPLEQALKNDVPGVRYTAASVGTYLAVLSVGDKRLRLRNLTAGADFLNIFRFPMPEGSRSEALKGPNSVVLTESTAKSLFGDTDPMNKIVRIYGSNELKVTGVLKDPPRNSSFQFDYITAFSGLTSSGWIKAATTNWNDCFFQMYVGLEPNAGYAQVTAASTMLVKKYNPVAYKASQQQVTMQPLRDWHLYTDFENGRAAGGIVDYLRLFSVIGVLVLLIASINFTNLSTARSEKRAREVGVRKVIGSSRKELILQFLIESTIITCLAFLLSLVFAQLAIPGFNELTGSAIRIPFADGSFWLIMSGYVLFTALVAGSKPAFYLSSFQPAQVLKGSFQTGQSAAFSRKALVVLQFTCSIALIIGTIVVNQQLQYARSRPTGYNVNRLLNSDASPGAYDALKNAVLSTGMVSSMTKSLGPTTEVWSHNTIDGWEGKSPNEAFHPAMNAVADTDYFRTLGIKIKEGANFSGNFGADSTCVILNEAAAERMRLKNPIGQFISWSPSNAPHRLRVIGVVNDALTNAPFGAAEPTIFVYQPGWTYSYIYRLAPRTNTEAALAALKPLFERYDPTLPYTYHFADEDYASRFHLEMLIGKLAGVFAALAIFICCLGLFGLAAYVAGQRTKEIGIRKVLGASIPQVLLLLTKDFVLLVMISCALASPIAYYFLHHWLQQYYYRISIGAGVFVVSAILAVMITVLTIGSQAIKAALMNPVKSLRTE